MSKILCTRRRNIQQVGEFFGVTTCVPRYWENIFMHGNAFYMEREMVENNPGIKQIIPYIVVYREDGKILCYNRTKKGGEKRLNDCWSIGVGGHIEMEKDAPQQTLGEDFRGVSVDSVSYWNGVEREVIEELGEKMVVLAPTLLVNNYDNEVGTVHFGIVHFLKLTKENADRLSAKKPDEQGEIWRDHAPVWRDLFTLLRLGEMLFEDWSILLLRYMEAVITSPNCECGIPDEIRFDLPQDLEHVLP